MHHAMHRVPSRGTDTFIISFLKMHFPMHHIRNARHATHRPATVNAQRCVRFRMHINPFRIYLPLPLMHNAPLLPLSDARRPLQDTPPTTTDAQCAFTTTFGCTSRPSGYTSSMRLYYRLWMHVNPFKIHHPPSRFHQCTMHLVPY